MSPFSDEPPMPLKPCPFCGGRAEHWQNGDEQSVNCRDCLARIYRASSEEGDVCALWNVRVAR